MSLQMVMYDVPKNKGEANDLAATLTLDYSKKGWSLISVVPLAGGTVLLFTFQQ